MMIATHSSNTTAKHVLCPRVLVVEDDEELGDVVEEILSEVFNFAVVRAFNADEALHLIRLQHFDLVFTDIVMPGSMNGAEMAQLIREDHPDMPVVLVTGNAPVASLPVVARFPLLRKPYRLDEMRAKFAEAGLPL